MYNKLTENDIQEMEKEIEHRKLVLRPQLLEEVKETRAHGDLSENFEYHAAKREKNRNESRIRFLERMIRTARSSKTPLQMTRSASAKLSPSISPRTMRRRPIRS